MNKKKVPDDFYISSGTFLLSTIGSNIYYQTRFRNSFSPNHYFIS